MEVNSIVSIWIGKHDSESEFKNYMQESYSDEGDLTSLFMKDFEIDFYDENFKEVMFKVANDKNNIFQDFSYSENFIEKIPDKNWGEYNSYVLLFNFEYDKSVLNTDKFVFLGSYNYR
ncbi:immunity 22 family protein [Flavobacterium terrisoli]|uniref:immunity 22 family protein n=1 Tax=Flavobacterium terrisoli TaxID=3242195 RepID=UPI00254305D5|nr:immunity 22 family protein [Flavobacterium buctense]